MADGSNLDEFFVPQAVNVGTNHPPLPTVEELLNPTPEGNVSVPEEEKKEEESKDAPLIDLSE